MGMYDIPPPPPPPPVVSPLASRQIRGMFNQTAAWMRSVGYNVPTPQVFVLPRVYGTPDGGPRVEGVAIHDDTGVTLSKASILNEMAALARAVYGRREMKARPKNGTVVISNPKYSPYDAMTVMHELTHGLTPREGMAESTSVDLSPAWWKRFIGERRGAGPPTYRTALAKFRMESAAATGKPWTSREARVWRRAQVNAGGR